MLTLTSISFVRRTNRHIPRPQLMAPCCAPVRKKPIPSGLGPHTLRGLGHAAGTPSARPRGTGSSFPRCDDSGPPPPFWWIAHSCDAPSFASGCPGACGGFSRSARYPTCQCVLHTASAVGGGHQRFVSNDQCRNG